MNTLPLPLPLTRSSAVPRLKLQPSRILMNPDRSEGQERNHLQDRSSQLSWTCFSIFTHPPLLAEVAPCSWGNRIATASTSNQGRRSLRKIYCLAKRRNRVPRPYHDYSTSVASTSELEVLAPLGSQDSFPVRLRPEWRSWSTSLHALIYAFWSLT